MRGGKKGRFLFDCDAVLSPEKELGAAVSMNRHLCDQQAPCLSVDEEYDGRVEWLAAEKNPHVHLETVEEAPNQVWQSTQTRHPGEVRLDGGDEQAWLLVHRGNRGR